MVEAWGWRLLAEALGGGGLQRGTPRSQDHAPKTTPPRPRFQGSCAAPRRRARCQVPCAHARAYARAHLGERDRDTCTLLLLPLMMTPPGGRVGGQGKVCTARAQQGDREGGDAAVEKRPCGCHRGDTVGAVSSADAKRSPAAAHHSPRACAMVAVVGGRRRGRGGGGEGGEAKLRKPRPRTCTPPRAHHRPVRLSARRSYLASSSTTTTSRSSRRPCA